MKFKSNYLVLLIALFAIFVFLDQNRTPVPMKFIFGNPFHFGLSRIILVSLLAGSGLTLAVYYQRNRKKGS